MTAKKMFKKLEYKIKENEDEIKYSKYFKLDDYESLYYVIIFNKNKKRIELDQFDFYEENYVLTLKELQAINKQIEELGWLDE